MKVVLICTEGQSSEPGNVNAIVNYFRSQVPDAYRRLEILPIPLNGNHGYRDLPQRAAEMVDQKLQEFELDPSQNEVYRFLVCDYDNMDLLGVDIEALRIAAKDKHFQLIVTKPKFEYFIARHFFTADELLTTNDAALIGKIQEGIDRYNADRPAYLQIPPYNKSHQQSCRCLGTLYNFDPSFIDRICDMEVDTSQDQYSELPILVRFLRELFYE